MTPYSALAGGRLSKKPGETSKRLQEDDYAKLKYNGTADEDSVIIARVAELAEKRGVSMTEISLAWLLTKATAPIVGATKLSHVEGMAKAADLCLTREEIDYLKNRMCPTRWWALWRRIQQSRQRKTCLVYGQSETVKKIDFIGSVVTRSIPEKAVAFGNLCRVHHYLETIAEMEADS